ncbi:MAG TPA: DUF2207 domain-containing protein [Bacillota bacterium]|nr:DUF2207 domain-containing protein [Bacillota bacterium]
MSSAFRWAKFAVIAVTLAVLFAAPSAHAQGNDFTINSFDAHYALTRVDPQGELHVTERIDVTFPGLNHGLLRAIPASYKNHRLQLHVASVSSDTHAPAQYSIYTENNNRVLKIGDPDKMVTGHQEYTIDYTVRNVITFYPDHDEFYWDINGDQWPEQTNHVSLQLQLPADLQLSQQQPICYAGGFGSLSRDCTVVVNQPQHRLSVQTNSGLLSNQTLSLVAGFQKDYFRPSTLLESVGEYKANILGFFVPFLLFAIPSGWYWFTRGRDPKGRGVIVPEYDVPKGLSTLDVGTIIDFKTDNKDITATIIGLAVRGYIKIIEQTEARRLRRDITKYTLRLVNIDKAGLTPHERTLLEGIFTDYTKDTEVDLSYLKYKLSTIATKLRKVVNDDLVVRGYFKKNVSAVAVSGIGSAVVFGLFLFMGILHGLQLPAAVAFGAIAGGVLAVMFFYFSSARTAQGVAAKEQILGLKMYLQFAEADRIKMLQSPSARYGTHGPGPARTVELFEKLLPYAIVLGVETDWAKQFEDIYRTPPGWYSGNWTTFNVLYLTSSLSDGIGGAVNSAFSSPSSSGSSGFSGGGAGGGGGGGGGGGW